MKKSHIAILISAFFTTQAALSITNPLPATRYPLPATRYPLPATRY